MSEKEKKREEIEKAERAYFREILKGVALTLFELDVNSKFICVPVEDLRRVMEKKYNYPRSSFQYLLEDLKKNCDARVEEMVIIPKEVFMED